MTIIRRTPPRRDIATVRDVFDRFFEETPFRAWGNFAESRLPLDISSTEDAISIEAALPGIRPEDVELTVHQDTLTIGVKEQAERETREGERVYREVRRSSGSRTLTLPSGLDIDRASAMFENGMLRVDIPRAEQAKPRQIPVTAVSEATSGSVSGGSRMVDAEQSRSEQAPAEAVTAGQA
jgi:HSP20 family protein